MRRVAFARLLFAGLLAAGVLSFTGLSGASSAGVGCESRLAGNAVHWRMISQGLDVGKMRIRFWDGASAGMTAVRIDSDRFKIRLKWQFGKSGLKATADIARAAKAAVAINAGYFDENGRPMGYFRSGGTLFNSRLLFRGRRRALHLGAIFYVLGKSGKARISTREEFDSRGVREAFQAGPYLVRNGRPDPGLDAYREYRRADRRTVLALGKKGRLIFMVSEEIGRGISWCELQDFLARSESGGGLETVEAMNLDGGSSSQLFVSGNGRPVNLAGRLVPALILAIPR